MKKLILITLLNLGFITFANASVTCVTDKYGTTICW